VTVLPLNDLLGRFESLGNNCEFGIVQSAGDCEQPGLFRNIGFLRTDTMIKMIEDNLGDLFEDGRFAITKPVGWPDYGLDCLTTGMRFHTAVPVELSEERAHATLNSFRFLKRKFQEDLLSGHKIFVYRHNSGEQTTPALAEALLAALRQYNPDNWLLFVTEAPRAEPYHGDVRLMADGLLIGEMQRLSVENPPIIDYEGWENMLRLALDLRNGVHAATRHQQVSGPLFEVAVEGMTPLTRLTVEASLLIPADYSGEDAGLTVWGYDSRRPQPVDLNRRDEWQRTSVTTVIPEGETRAVVVLSVDNSEPPVNILSKNWTVRTAPARKRYRLAQWSDLPPELYSPTQHDDLDIPLIPIEFGQRLRPDFPVKEYPEGGWEQTRIVRDNVASAVLNNALVHGEQGIVTVGDYVLVETLRLATFTDQNGPLWEDDPAYITLPDAEPSVSLPRACPLFCGSTGIHNFAHWLIDVIPSASAEFTPTDMPLLWSRPRYRWQERYLDLLEVRDRSLFLSSGSIQVDRLHMTPIALTDSGHFPYPKRMSLFHGLKEKVGWDRDAKRNLYISRRDSGARPLANEDEVMAFLQSRGFEVLTLGHLTVDEQIQAFAEAEVVVAAHGAGNTNVVYCKPGTVFCELLVDNYVQWSMRFLASIVPLRYGCIVGREHGDPETHAAFQHGISWSIDVRQLERALDDLSAERSQPVREEVYAPPLRAVPQPSFPDSLRQPTERPEPNQPQRSLRDVPPARRGWLKW
jgi:hypothetical protein